MQNIMFNFESGTTLEERKEYFETIKEKFKDKFTEEELEHLKKQFEKNIKTVCDSCNSEITEEKKCEYKYDFSCKRCGLKYDLCESCQMDESLIKCPENFGCNNTKNEDRKIFVPKKIDKPFEKYEMFGESFIETDSSSVEMKMTELSNEINKCKKTYFLGAIYIETKNISYKFIKEMWFYFRCNDEKCLEKYGKPKSFNVEPELGNWKIYRTYDEISSVFKKFISLDEKNGKNFLLNIIFPNEDLFIIKKHHDDDEIPFTTTFIPVSTLQMETKNYDIEIFEEALKEKLKLTIEELNEKGQTLLLECLKEE